MDAPRYALGKGLVSAALASAAQTVREASPSYAEATGYANVTAIAEHRRLRHALATDATAQTEAIAKRAETIAEAKPFVAVKMAVSFVMACPTNETKKPCP